MSTCSQPRCGRNNYNYNSFPTPATYDREIRNTNDASCIDNFALAMAYVPMQRFKNLYEPDEALQCGTIFSELNKPFMGWKGGRPC